jgi:hypothetical protein
MSDVNVTQPEVTEFFSLGAKYLIAPGSKPDDLLNDAGDLMDSAIEVLNSQMNELNGVMYAALYLMQQAKSVQAEAHQLLFKAGVVKA